MRVRSITIQEALYQELEELVKLGDFPSVEAAVEALLREGIRKRRPEVRPPCT